MWANIDPMSSPSVITDQHQIGPVTIISFSELTIRALKKNRFCEIQYFFAVVPKYPHEKSQL